MITVSDPDEAHEREAERIAGHITSGEFDSPRELLPAPPRQIQRTCAACSDEAEENTLFRRATRTSPLAGLGTVDPGIRPSASGLLRDGNRLRLTREATAQVDGIRRSSGDPLQTSERAFFEPRIGRDLSGVRIHRGPDAAGLASRIDARAFTLGNHIFFARGEFRPGTSIGRHLLAHELVHTMQHSSVGATRLFRAPATASTPSIEPIRSVPDDLYIATISGLLGQVPNLDDRIAQLNYDQSLRLYEEVEYYFRLYKTGQGMILDQKIRGNKARGTKFDERQRRDIYNAVYSYKRVRSMLEDRVGIIRAHRAYTRPSLLAPANPGVGDTAFDTTVAAIRPMLKPEERDFFDHLYDVIRLDLDYLLSGDQVPALMVSERPLYGHLQVGILEGFFEPYDAPIALSDLAPHFTNPAESIANGFAAATVGKETPKDIVNRIAEKYDEMDDAYAKMRFHGAGTCEQGGTANHYRVCKLIRIILCMSRDKAYLYSALPTAGPIADCPELLK